MNCSAERLPSPNSASIHSPKCPWPSSSFARVRSPPTWITPRVSCCGRRGPGARPPLCPCGVGSDLDHPEGGLLQAPPDPSGDVPEFRLLRRREVALSLHDRLLRHRLLPSWSR